MEKLNLSAPWYTYQKKIKALFERDPDIAVGELYPAEGGYDYAFDVLVSNRQKYMALDRVLNRTKMFGSFALLVNLQDADQDSDDAIELYKAIFDGNPIVRDIREAVDAAGVHHGFVRFQPEVIQFYNDDLSDYDRNWNGLAQDIAREAFDNVAHGISFCTASLRENGALPE